MSTTGAKAIVDVTFFIAIVATGVGCPESDGSADARVVDAGDDMDAGSDGSADADVVDTGDEMDAGSDVGGGGDVDGGANDGMTRVFVTSMKYDGNLGGLVGADARCQALAGAATLGGAWIAWLGDGTVGPSTRFVRSDARYGLVGGGVVAENWSDLIDGTIGVPIDHDETGTALPPTDDMIVWTAVFHTGGNPTPVSCSGWTTAEATLVPTGLASATNTGWTVFAPHNCSEMHRLYCFEQ